VIADRLKIGEEDMWHAWQRKDVYVLAGKQKGKRLLLRPKAHKGGQY
jgi:hypothetical protein